MAFSCDGDVVSLGGGIGKAVTHRFRPMYARVCRVDDVGLFLRALAILTPRLNVRIVFRVRRRVMCSLLFAHQSRLVHISSLRFSIQNANLRW